MWDERGRVCAVEGLEDAFEVTEGDEGAAPDMRRWAKEGWTLFECRE